MAYCWFSVLLGILCSRCDESGLRVGRVPRPVVPHVCASVLCVVDVSVWCCVLMFSPVSSYMPMGVHLCVLVCIYVFMLAYVTFS
jgi:hypothetical protein